jgi:hypothetical protein
MSGKLMGLTYSKYLKRHAITYHIEDNIEMASHYFQVFHNIIKVMAKYGMAIIL